MRTLTPVDKIDRDLRAARQLRRYQRSPEQNERLQAEIDRLLDERNEVKPCSPTP